jgi:hypothetical protein
MLAPIPEIKIGWTDQRLRGGWLAVILAAAVGLAFMPKYITVADEYFYAGQAFTLSKGRIVPEAGDPLPFPAQPAAAAFRYPILWPAVLAVGRSVSVRAMFVVALLAHWLGGMAVARMLVRRGVPSWLAAVYLFHPVFWTYSRTLMSGGPSVAAMMIAMDAWENHSSLVAGVAFGGMSGLRLASAAPAAGFLVSVGRQWRQNVRGFLAIAAGAVAFFGIQAAVNYRLAGSVVSPYARGQLGWFSVGTIASNIAFYVGALAVLPPFSLVMFLVRPRATDRWAWVAVASLAFSVLVSYRDLASGFLETLVGAQRYAMAAHAALLVSTSRVWSAIRPFRTRWVVLAGGVAMGISGSAVMVKREGRYRPAVEALAACKAQRIAYNAFASKVAGSVNAVSYREVETVPPANREWDVLVVAGEIQTGRPDYPAGRRFDPPVVEGTTCQRIGGFALYDATGNCPSRGKPCWGASGE